MHDRISKRSLYYAIILSGDLLPLGEEKWQITRQ